MKTVAKQMITIEELIMENRGMMRNTFVLHIQTCVYMSVNVDIVYTCVYVCILHLSGNILNFISSPRPSASYGNSCVLDTRIRIFGRSDTAAVPK